MSLYYKIMFNAAKLIFPRPKFTYEEPPEKGEPCVYIANHAGAVGPSYATLYFDNPKKIWLIGYVTDKKKNVKYIYHDFLNAPAKKHRKCWKLLAKLVAFFLTPLLKNAPILEIYHDGRMIDAFRNTIDCLEKGENIIIFPESPKPFSPYINDFYSGFSELGKMYYDRTGKILKFYPAYLCKDLRTVAVGKPTAFDPNLPAKPQRTTIAESVRNELVAVAEKLPPHKIQHFLADDWYTCYGKFADNPSEYFKMFEDDDFQETLPWVPEK